jgi:hypothetical protein
MADKFIDHVNDLLSSFMFLIFEEADRRNLDASLSHANGTDRELRRKLVCEKDFRDLMESAILNNGALSDTSIRTLQQYPDNAPPPDKETWGVWGKHFTTYQHAHSVDFSAGMASILTDWIHIATAWGVDSTSRSDIEVRPTSNCILMMFHCLQFIVYTVVFKYPWLYLPILEERDMLLTRLNDATRTALVMEHVRVDSEQSGEVMAALKQVFDDGHVLSFQRPALRL